MRVPSRRNPQAVTDDRPDPDQLLARVQREEREETRGKLRIFFGACAGVGKTYAMLSAARLCPFLALNAGEELVGVGAFVLHRRRAAARAAPGS